MLLRTFRRAIQSSGIATRVPSLEFFPVLAGSTLLVLVAAFGFAATWR
jgi:hypothetical protein